MATIDELIRVSKHLAGWPTDAPANPNTWTEAVQKFQEGQKHRQEMMKKRSDMYKTLRDAGYDPKRAHQAVIKNEFPKEIPTGETKEQVEIEETKAKTRYYDRRSGGGTDVKGMRTNEIQRRLKEIEFSEAPDDLEERKFLVEELRKREGYSPTGNMGAGKKTGKTKSGVGYTYE